MHYLDETPIRSALTVLILAAIDAPKRRAESRNLNRADRTYGSQVILIYVRHTGSPCVKSALFGYV